MPVTPAEGDVSTFAASKPIENGGFSEEKRSDTEPTGSFAVSFQLHAREILLLASDTAPIVLSGKRRFGRLILASKDQHCVAHQIGGVD